jgi:hypothetical protein
MNESLSDLCGEPMSVNKVLKQVIMTNNPRGLCRVFESNPGCLCKSVFSRTEAIFYRRLFVGKNGLTIFAEGCPCEEADSRLAG